METSIERDIVESFEEFVEITCNQWRKEGIFEGNRPGIKEETGNRRGMGKSKSNVNIKLKFSKISRSRGERTRRVMLTTLHT